jgi:hypothetical protein
MGGKMMDSTDSDSWKNYCMAGEHMHITNLFLNNYKNGKISLKFLPVR